MTSHEVYQRNSPIAFPPDFVPFTDAELDLPVTRLIERQAARAPERLAVRDGAQALPYGALNAAANRLARLIQARCGEANDPIATLLPAGIPALVATLAVLKAGKIFTPLTLNMPAARIRALLANAQARLLLTDAPRFALAAESAEGLCAVLNVETVEAGREDNLPLDVPLDQPALLLHTSGSTGQPKGVLHSGRLLQWSIADYCHVYGHAASDRSLWLAPALEGNVIRYGLSPLACGASVFPRDLSLGDYPELARLALAERITLFGFAPTPLRQFLAAVEPDRRFPDVRCITLGGEAVHRADLDSFRRHFAAHCVLCTSLGTTETGVFRTFFIRADAPFEGSVLPTGYAVPDKSVLLLDDDGNDVPPGETGEIAVKSRSNALGYWRLPELTRERFKADPAGSGATIYLTGDLGRLLPDGCLEHRGRKDQQLKVRGFRVESTEVEMLLATSGGVKEAAVTTRPDAHGEPRLVAYIIPSTNPPPSVTALRQAVAARLPDYMVPSAFVFVSEFPLAASGKVNRRLLPDPAPERPALSVPYAAPRTPSEQSLARIWSEVLGVAPVGIDDPFLDLGGHSILAARIVARVLAEFRVDLPVGALFDAPTVAAMAVALAAAQGAQLDAPRLEALVHGIEALPEAEASELLARAAAP